MSAPAASSEGRENDDLNSIVPTDFLPEDTHLIALLQQGEDEEFADLTIAPHQEAQIINKHFNSFNNLREKHVEEPSQCLVPKELTMDNFAQRANEEGVQIGSIDLEEVEKQEAKLEQDRVRAMQHAEQQQVERATLMIRREGEARAQLDKKNKQSMKELKRQQTRLVRSKAATLSHVAVAFKAVRLRLNAVLHAQKKLVSHYFGAFQSATHIFGEDGQHYKHNWNACPRSIRISVDYLREVKDKLRGGKYVMMCTVYDRLGGHPLRVSGNKHFSFTSSPVLHTGTFQQKELEFSQPPNHLKLQTPSQSTARPSNVLLFELFCVRSRRQERDEVVGWGVLPLMSATFETLQGKFKFPLLRGRYDPRIDKFQKFEKRIVKDIDNWLCNCYVSVSHCSRQRKAGVWGNKTINEHKEQARFHSKFLHVARPAAQDSESESEEEEEIVEEEERGGEGGGGGGGGGSDQGSSVHASSSSSSSTATAAGASGLGGDDGAALHAPDFKFSAPLAAKSPLAAGKAFNFADIADGQVEREGKKGNGNKGEGGGALQVAGKAHTTPATPTGRGLRMMHSTRSLKDLAAASSRRLLVSHPSAKRGAGVEGTATTTNSSSSNSSSSSSILKMPDFVGSLKDKLAKYEQCDQQEVANATDSVVMDQVMKRQRNVELQRKLRQYNFSLKNPDQNVPMKAATLKLKYLWSEMVSDLSFRRYKTLECWATVVLLVMSFWFRMYSHYLGQYVFLLFNNISIWKFETLPYKVDLQYADENIGLQTQLYVVIFGMLANQFVYAAFMLVTFFIQVACSSYPDMFSKFLLALGIMVILDPVLILLVDVATGAWDTGDMFKIYRWFLTNEGTGLGGVVLTAGVVFVTAVFSMWLYYAYLLNLHMNGRMMDVHHRLFSDEGKFYFPEDSELSVRTLRHILHKSAAWVGLHGTRRKLNLTAFTVLDHTDPSFKDISLHLVIYNVTPPTKKRKVEERSVFRRFVRRHDGTLLEVFEGGEGETYLQMEEEHLKRVDSQAEKHVQAIMQDMDLIEEANELLEEQMLEHNGKKKRGKGGKKKKGKRATAAAGQGKSL